MTGPCSACLNALAQHEVECVLAIQKTLCSVREVDGRRTITLPDVALFEIADPWSESIPLDAAWDIGALTVCVEGIRFDSDIQTVALRVDDLREVRVAGCVAVVAAGPSDAGMMYVGFGGYPTYASLIALSIRLAAGQHTASATSWLVAFRDSVLDHRHLTN